MPAQTAGAAWSAASGCHSRSSVTFASASASASTAASPGCSSAGTGAASAAGWASGTRDAATVAGTEEAIRTDPRLTPEQRAALLGVYRSFVVPD